MANALRSRELVLTLLANDADKITGVSSYTFSLLRAMEARHDVPLRLITTWSCEGVARMGLTRTQVNHVPVGHSGMLTPIGYTLATNRYLRRGSEAVLVSTSPMGSFTSVVPQITVYHDLYRRIPGRYAKHQRFFFEAYARVALHASAAVVAVSHVTAGDLLAWQPGVRDRLHVIGEGSQFESEPSYDPARTELLFVANVEGNKGTSYLLDALRLLEEAGDPVNVRWIGRDRSGEVRRWLAANGQLPSLTSLGVVDAATLAAEYRRAGALVVTSTAEGFCLPVVEAHGFGVPTILSDIPILREVGGDAGLYVTPRDPVALAEAIRRFRSDADLRERLSIQAVANAGRHSWANAAAAIVTLADDLRRRSSRTR